MLNPAIDWKNSNILFYFISFYLLRFLFRDIPFIRILIIIYLK